MLDTMSVAAAVTVTESVPVSVAASVPVMVTGRHDGVRIGDGFSLTSDTAWD